MVTNRVPTMSMAKRLQALALLQAWISMLAVCSLISGGRGLMHSIPAVKNPVPLGSNRSSKFLIELASFGPNILTNDTEATWRGYFVRVFDNCECGRVFTTESVQSEHTITCLLRS